MILLILQGIIIPYNFNMNDSSLKIGDTPVSTGIKRISLKIRYSCRNLYFSLPVHVILKLSSDWSVLRGKAIKQETYLPPVTKKYERRTKAKTTMADGAFTHPGFFNFRFGTSNTWKGIAYKASILERERKEDISKNMIGPAVQ